MKSRFGIAVAIALLGASLSAAQDAEGEKLYKFHCSFCHGRGDDGMAANLVQVHLRRAPTDNSLMGIIRDGIPGTDMPGALGMSDDEVRKVAAYVRFLGRSAPQAVPGDAARGAALYKSKGGCAGCHMINGAGGRMGPDLSAIGAMRSPSNLRSSLVDPDAVLAAGFITAKAVMKDGRTITGIRLNEDTFSVQIRDARAAIHSLQKSDIAKLEKNLTKSSMPSYRGRLSDAETDDMVAYLFSLRGEK